MAAIFKKLAPRWLSRRTLPLAATLAVFVILYAIACICYRNFYRPDVFLGFFRDESFLGIAALGTTFVILSGGIDLSVGSMVGCTGIILATLISKEHLHPFAAMALVLAGALLFGVLMGALIHFFALTPFLVTLGGLFVLRGIALLVSEESISIDHPLYERLGAMALPLGGGFQLSLVAIIFILTAITLVIISLHTPFGRNVYAVGGNETSALLMGLPVGATKIGVYALGGFCSGLAGVVYTIMVPAGNAVAGTGMELDAIAAVVVGGTLLTGGVGYVAGTPLGVLTFAVIQEAITFDGRPSSWWVRIAIGALLLGFVCIQQLIQAANL